MKKYIMALDQGTTSSRCILFQKDGSIASMVQREFPQIFPCDGWVEHDPMTIWSTQISVATEALLKIGASWSEVYGIGITNQRETVIVWNRKTGAPVYNAIVWQCRRTADFCKELIDRGLEETIKRKTGLVLDPYFSASKIKWILDNVEGARELAENGELCLGTVDSWLIWNLTGGRIHATDPSNASRTMLFNINTLAWDEELCSIFDIPMSMLPSVMPSSCIFGYTDKTILGAEIAIGGVAGDQQAALFGQCCFDEGELKNTYGTGAFLLMNTGDHTASGNEIVQTQADKLVIGIVEGTDALEAGHFGHVHIQRDVEGLESIAQRHAVGQLGAVGGGAVGGNVVGLAAMVVPIVEALLDDGPHLFVGGGAVVEHTHEVSGVALLVLDTVFKGQLGQSARGDDLAALVVEFLDHAEIFQTDHVGTGKHQNTELLGLEGVFEVKNAVLGGADGVHCVGMQDGHVMARIGGDGVQYRHVVAGEGGVGVFKATVGLGLVEVDLVVERIDRVEHGDVVDTATATEESLGSGDEGREGGLSLPP